MAITSVADVTNALKANDCQKMALNKLTTTGTAGRYTSLWRTTGTPTQGAIPTTLAICSKGITGAWNYNSPDTANNKAHYIAGGVMLTNASFIGYEFHDRLVHMGGLDGTLTTLQTVGLNVTGTATNLQQRLGPADLTEVQWFMEFYTATGTTAVTANVDVTHTDATTATIAVSLPVSVQVGNAFLLASPTPGKIIASIDAVTLSASTGTAGNFGFTASRRLFTIDGAINNYSRKLTHVDTELVNVYDNSCIQLMTFSNSGVTGSLTGYINLIHK